MDDTARLHHTTLAVFLQCWDFALFDMVLNMLGLCCRVVLKRWFSKTCRWNSRSYNGLIQRARICVIDYILFKLFIVDLWYGLLNLFYGMNIASWYFLWTNALYSLCNLLKFRHNQLWIYLYFTQTMNPTTIFILQQ